MIFYIHILDNQYIKSINLEANLEFNKIIHFLNIILNLDNHDIHKIKDIFIDNKR